jgi:hypothetical protein
MDETPLMPGLKPAPLLAVLIATVTGRDAGMGSEQYRNKGEKADVPVSSA